MQTEMLMLKQMFSGNYLPAVLLAGLFAALLFRRDSISSYPLFRLGYIFFILSLVLPALAESFLIAVNVGGGSRGGFPGEGTPYAILNIIGPIFQGIGLMCTLGSLIPQPAKRTPFVPPASPQRHPPDA
jgi:hypothetical protein